MVFKFGYSLFADTEREKAFLVALNRLKRSTKTTEITL